MKFFVVFVAFIALFAVSISAQGFRAIGRRGSPVSIQIGPSGLPEIHFPKPEYSEELNSSEENGPEENQPQQETENSQNKSGETVENVETTSPAAEETDVIDEDITVSSPAPNSEVFDTNSLAAE